MRITLKKLILTKGYFLLNFQNMLSVEKKERIRTNLKLFTESLPKSVSNRENLVNAMEEIMDEVSFVEKEKADASDIKLLILEMREGFKRMDERFAAVDKRFESVERHISFLQWIMGFSMVFIAFLITLFSYLKPPISQEMLEKAIISGIEKSNRGLR